MLSWTLPWVGFHSRREMKKEPAQAKLLIGKLTYQFWSEIEENEKELKN